MTKFEDHPIAEIFPIMGEDEIQALAADIKKNGCRQEILIHEDKILDGRNRYRACKIAGVDPVFRRFTGKDPLQFVLSLNLHRRHLDTSQRAMVAAKISNLEKGNFSKSANLHISPISQPTAAKKMDVSTRSVATAKEVLKSAPAAEVAAIERGEKTVSAVAKELKEKKTPTMETDATGIEIPKEIQMEWDRAKSIDGLIREISKIRNIAATAMKDRDPVWVEVNQQLLIDLDEVKRFMKGVIPYAICPYCQGHGRKACTHCKKRGFVSKYFFEQCAASELKAMRNAKRKK